MTIQSSNFPTIKPALTLDFANSKRLDPRIAFARGSQGTYVDSDGLLKTAASGVARFTHDPVTGESLGLLVEEQRVNLLQRTEEFQTTWGATRTSVLADSLSAPDATLTADKLVEDASAANTHFVQQTSSVVSGLTYTLSVYAKAGERSEINIQLAIGFPSTSHRVNLNTGTTIDTSGSPLATSVQMLPDGWYRISVTQTANLTTTASQSNIYISVGGSTVYTGNGTSGIYLWGAQLEAGAFPTSYIRNVDNPLGATRAADVVSITGAAFTSFYNQNEGTMFARGSSNSTSTPHFAEIHDGSIANRLTIGYLTQSLGGLIVRKSGPIVAQLYPSASNADRKVAYSFATDAYAACANGEAVLSANSGTLHASMSGMTIGSNVNNGAFSAMNGAINRLVYWSQRLPNETLQAITQ